MARVTSAFCAGAWVVAALCLGASTSSDGHGARGNDGADHAGMDAEARGEMRGLQCRGATKLLQELVATGAPLAKVAFAAVGRHL